MIRTGAEAIAAALTGNETQSHDEWAKSYYQLSQTAIQMNDERLKLIERIARLELALLHYAGSDKYYSN